MKSFTRVGLPILMVVAVVFGITFVRIYSPDDEKPDGGPKSGSPGKAAARREPLRLLLSTASPLAGAAEPGRESLTYWNPEIEVGVPGHFEFWAHNPNPDPVTVRVFDVNCQCAGVEMTVVPQDAFRDYAVESALAGGPLGTASGPLAALAHARLGRRLTWEMMLDKDHKGENTDRLIPAADPAAGTQVALFRLGWNPKEDPGPKEVKARIGARFGDDQPKPYDLIVQSLVVPAFDAVRRDGTAAFAPAGELPLGDLREGREVRRAVYLMSTTRRHMVYSITADHPDPCVTWTDPVPATDEEARALTEFMSQAGKFARRLASVYKFEVTVRERAAVSAGGKTEYHRLDLGQTDRRLTVKGVEAGTVHLALQARVLGEIEFLAGAPDGRIDLGNSFPASEDRTRDVILVADRPGLDLSVSTAETAPNYLKVRLDPQEKLDGRDRWRLRVTVPKGQLRGALPPNSAVYLSTGGPTPRKVRIPVRGMAYDSGGPRI